MLSNNRHLILALKDDSYLNGTPIRRYHESISARCNGSYLHSDGDATRGANPGGTKRSGSHHLSTACAASGNASNVVSIIRPHV